MSLDLRGVVGSSIFRKQLIALTGLVMVGFVVAHLSGNLLIYAGPKVFNAYAKALADIGPVLWVMRVGLISSVLLHVYLTLKLAAENTAARGQRYKVEKTKGDRSFATRMMKYSGILIVLFLALHLYDFTFSDHSSPKTIIEGLNDGESLGLFGLVWYSFKQMWRDFIYILAVSAVGLHLSHAIQSVFQTFGLNHDRYTPIVKKVSIVLGVAIAVGFGSIPIYVLIMKQPLGV